MKTFKKYQEEQEINPNPINPQLTDVERRRAARELLAQYGVPDTAENIDEMIRKADELAARIMQNRARRS